MSTFETYAKKADSKKIVLVHYHLEVQNLEWVVYSPFNYYCNFDATYSGVSSIFLSHYSGRTDVKHIGIVREEQGFLAKETSIANVESTAGTFFWDGANNNLHVHCLDDNHPRNKITNIGITQGWISGNGEDSPEGPNTYSGFLHEYRIESLPGVSASRPNNFYGVMVNPGGSVAVKNQDAFFNSFLDDYYLAGNMADIYIGFEDLPFSEFKKVFTGTSENISIGQIMNIDFADAKEILQEQIPNKELTQSYYPNLSDNNIGKFKPYRYGYCNRVECICLNEDEGGSSFTFLAADTTHHSIKEISTIYNTTENTNPTAVTTNLRNGTFTLSSSDYTKGDEILVDMQGYDDSTGKDGSGSLISETLDVMKDILVTQYGYEYSDTFFLTSEWDDSSDQDYDVGLSLEKGTKIIDIMKDLALTIPGYFEYTTDRKFSFRNYNVARTIYDTIKKEEILNYFEPRVDLTEGATSIRCGYAKRWKDDDYRYQLDDTQKNTLVYEFKRFQPQQQETLLYDLAGANSFNSRYMDLYGGQFPVVEIELKMQVAGIKPLDMIDVELDRHDSSFLGIKTCEVISVSYDFSSFTMTLKLRIIEDTQWTTLVDEDGNYLVDEDDNYLLGR